MQVGKLQSPEDPEESDKWENDKAQDQADEDPEETKRWEDDK